MVHSRTRLAHVIICALTAGPAHVLLAQAPAPPPADPGAAAPEARNAAEQQAFPDELGRTGQATIRAYEPAQPQLAVWAGYADSDNIARTEVNPADGTFRSIGLLADLSHRSSRVEARLDSDLEYRRYSDETIDDETVGTLNASARFDIVPDRFSWRFDENYGQGLTDAFAPISPSNRESINVLSTMPRLTVPVGARTTFDASAGLNRRRYGESTDSDSNSTAYELGLLRAISRIARAGLIANTKDIDYTSSGAQAYQIDTLSVRYEKVLATGRVLAQAGKNEIKSGGFENDEPYYQFEWTRGLTSRSDLSVTASRQYTDSGTALGTPTAGSAIGDTASDILVAPNPYQRKGASVAYTVRMTRTVLGVSAGYANEDYVGNTAYNNDGTALLLTLSHDVSVRLQIGLSYYNDDRDFHDTGTPRPDDRNRTTSVWVNRSLAKKLNVAFAASQYGRRGSSDFDETRYEIRFGYSPTQSGAATMRSLSR